MKGLVYQGPKELVWQDVSDVHAGEKEVRIKIKAVGICGSDVHGYLGLTGRRIAPMIMGHEFSGEVDQVGDGVTSVAVGDRVTAQPVQFCGTCEFCAQGLTNLCASPKKKFFGVLDCNGAMAEYLVVPERLLYKLPDTLGYEAGALAEAVAVAYRGVKRAGDLTGKHVLVIGAGTIGLLVLALVKMRGAEKVYISDLSDGRLAVAQQMGADVLLNPGTEDVLQRVKELTGGKGVDISLEAVGVTPSAKQSIELLRTGGHAVWIGNSAKTVEIPMQDVVTRELRIDGTFIYTHEEFGEAVELLGSGAMHVEPMISLVADMQRGPELFAKLADDPGDLIKVILS